MQEDYKGPQIGDSNNHEVLRQIVSGLEHLHLKGIVHRDLKPGNILISIPDGKVPPRIKLADFGVSRKGREGQSKFDRTVGYMGCSPVFLKWGTEGWVGPEVYEDGKNYSFKVDIFPLGCICGFLFSKGRHPFGTDCVTRIKNKQPMVLTIEDLKEEDKKAFPLMKKMVEPNPNNRPTAKEILQDDFFKPELSASQNEPVYSSLSSHPQPLSTSTENCIITKSTFSKSTAKSSVGILMDEKINSVMNKVETASAYLIKCLRYRTEIAFEDGDDLNKVSLYDILLDLLEGFDASGRAEIFRLLLERRSAIPLILPNGEHHFPILRLLNRTIGNNDQSVCIGDDINLLRLTVVSCRQKKDSQATELLKNVFHLSSLHCEDFSRDVFTEQSTTAEIGLGCILPLTGNRNPIHLLVLNIVGNFDPLWDFISVFSDYLIIEDSKSKKERFYHRTKDTLSCTGLEEITKVLVWETSDKFSPIKQFNKEDASNDLGFSFLKISAPPNAKLFNEIIKNVLGQSLRHSNDRPAKKMLHQMSFLLPKTLKEIDCSMPFDIQLSIQNVQNFSTLRTETLMLQKSFNVQAKHEEEKTKNRNNESIINETDLKINEQVALRKLKASFVEKNPLLETFIKLIAFDEASIRILSIREMEKFLAMRSETIVRPLRMKIDILSSQYAELSQSKSGQKEKLDEVKQELQETKDQYNSIVVGIEHLWRELGQLYAADPSKYRKQNII